MKKTILKFLLIPGLVGFLACNNSTDSKTSEVSVTKEAASFDLAAAKTSIEAANAKFVETFLKGDSTGVANLYTADAMVLPPNMQTVKGSSIAGFWGGFMKMGVKNLKLITDNLEGNNEQLVETGHYEIYGDGDKIMDKGKYIVAWKPVDGSWKLHRDIFNSDMPMPAAK